MPEKFKGLLKRCRNSFNKLSKACTMKDPTEEDEVRPVDKDKQLTSIRSGQGLTLGPDQTRFMRRKKIIKRAAEKESPED